jgi:hypothetical protein
VLAGKSSVIAGFSDAKSDKKFFEKMFVGATMVRDLLHFFKDFHECIPMRNAYRSTIISAVTSISYTYSDADIANLRIYLARLGKSEIEINKIIVSPSRIKKYRNIARPQLVTAEEFLPKFERIISHFTRLSCFNAVLLAKFQRKLDDKVALSFKTPTNFVRFINISPDLDNPRFRVVAGTNMIENQNGRMQQVGYLHFFSPLTQKCRPARCATRRIKCMQ